MTEHHESTEHNQQQENYWLNELKKESLKEPKLKSKFFWIKPMSIFHQLEFRGIDPRDKYQPAPIDEWDAQVWNLATEKRGLCKEYYVEYSQCNLALINKYKWWKTNTTKRGTYCWKQHDNYMNCFEEFGHHNPEWYIKGSNLGHH